MLFIENLPCFPFDEVENHDGVVTSLGVTTLLIQIYSTIYTGKGGRPVHHAGSRVRSLTPGRYEQKVL